MEQGADFCGTRFIGASTWEDAVAKGHVTIGVPPLSAQSFVHLEDSETIYRLAKYSARRLGDERRAGEYHYAEKYAANCRTRVDARNAWREAIDKGSVSWAVEAVAITAMAIVDWFLGKVVFGYGERPWNPLYAGFGVILGCAVLYGVSGGICGFSTTCGGWLDRIGEPLYFSTVTFTTLGYGDMKPCGVWMRLLAASEALSGATLMALFVVSLARRFTR